jgi:hypothetical protein
VRCVGTYVETLVFCCYCHGSACALQPELPSAPPEGLETAWFHDDCAPQDGFMTSLYLDAKSANAFKPASQPHVAVYSTSFKRAEAPGVQYPATRDTRGTARILKLHDRHSRRAEFSKIDRTCWKAASKSLQRTGPCSSAFYSPHGVGHSAVTASPQLTHRQEYLHSEGTEKAVASVTSPTASSTAHTGSPLKDCAIHLHDRKCRWALARRNSAGVSSEKKRNHN